MQMLVDSEELAKIEAKHGKFPRLGKDEVKWLLPPDWKRKKMDAVLVEVPESKAREIFEKFRVKLLRKR